MGPPMFQKSSTLVHAKALILDKYMYKINLDLKNPQKPNIYKEYRL